MGACEGWAVGGQVAGWACVREREGMAGAAVVALASAASAVAVVAVGRFQ